MKATSRITMCLLIILLFHFHGFAWGVLGHRVVAEIAQRHLSSKAKKELSKLIGREPLAMWANWADFIKSDSTWEHADPWHYLNVRGNLEKDDFLVELRQGSQPSLYLKLPEMIQTLRNKANPPQKREEALRWIIHLIGDLHQPLHVGRPEDRGGNNIAVFWFGRRTNLHSVWDTDLVEFQQYSYTEYAKILDLTTPGQIRVWQQSSLDEWFHESYATANLIYKLTPPESRLGYHYNYMFQSTIDNQLLKGGIRLAGILNTALK